MAGKQTSQKPRLGRGLSSLVVNTAPPEQADEVGTYIGSGAQAGKTRAVDVPIDRIAPNPHQPRKSFDPQQLAELTQSIREQGVLQPLLVCPAEARNDGKDFVLIAGHRRLEAARAAGLDAVPVHVRAADAEQLVEWAVIENIQRSDLNAVERGQAYRDIMDRFNLTQVELANRLGSSRESVSNYLRILDLADSVQELLLNGKLSFGHARALAGLSGRPDRQLSLARQTINKQLSVRQLEALVAADRQRPAGRDAPPKRPTKAPYLADLEQQLTRQLSTAVTITPGKRKHTGKLTIEYHSLEDFDRIVAALGAQIES